VIADIQSCTREIFIAAVQNRNAGELLKLGKPDTSNHKRAACRKAYDQPMQVKCIRPTVNRSERV
jgi:hypothetical protein